MKPADLKRSLAALGWSQAELARRIGAHPNTVSKWMTGKAAVSGAAAAYVEVHVKLREITK